MLEITVRARVVFERIIVVVVFDLDVNLHQREVSASNSTTILGISGNVRLVVMHSRTRVWIGVSINKFQRGTGIRQGFDLPTNKSSQRSDPLTCNELTKGLYMDNSFLHPSKDRNFALSSSDKLKLVVAGRNSLRKSSIGIGPTNLPAISEPFSCRR